MKKVFREYLTTLGLIWLGCLIVFVFVYMLVLKPQSRFKRSLSKELEEKKQDYIAARAASNEEIRKGLVLDVERLENQLRKFVADANGYTDLTFDVSRIANKNNVLSFSIKSRNNKGTYDIPQCKLIGEGKMDVSFSSDFRQFAMFLNGLERHQPMVFVDSFSITKGDRLDESNRVSMSISVLVEREKGS
jgi:hypothetical protein